MNILFRGLLLNIILSNHLSTAYITTARHSLFKLSKPCFISSSPLIIMKRSLSDSAATDKNNNNANQSSSTFVAPLYCPPGFNIKRVRQLTQTSLLDTVGSTQTKSSSSTDVSDSGSGCVVYWMTRDQRAHDNYSLLYAQGLAARLGVPVRVVFNLVPKYLDATLRQYGTYIRYFTFYYYHIISHHFINYTLYT